MWKSTASFFVVLAASSCGNVSPDRDCGRVVAPERYDGTMFGHDSDLLIIRPPSLDPMIGCRAPTDVVELPCETDAREFPVSGTFHCKELASGGCKHGLPYVVMERPVSYRQYLECVEAGECPALRNKFGSDQPWLDETQLDEPVSVALGADIARYCFRARGMQHCDEVQWEIAARGRSGFAFAWGDDSAQKCSEKSGLDVKAFLAAQDVSEFGMRSVHGTQEVVSSRWLDYATGCALDANPDPELGCSVEIGPGCCRQGGTLWRGGLVPTWTRWRGRDDVDQPLVEGRCCAQLPN